MPRPETGSIRLDAPSAFVDPLRARPELVADWAAVEGGMRPTEITLTVDREANTATEYSFVAWASGAIPELAMAPVGPIWPGVLAVAHGGGVDASVGTERVWESPNAGAFRITYSRAGVGRTVFCDLRSQRLYLGNCDLVRVEAMRWATSNTLLSDLLRDHEVWRVSAHVGLAQGGVYDEAVLTMMTTPEVDPYGSTPAETFVASLYPPPHSSAFEPFVSEYLADAVVGGQLGNSESEASVYESADPDFRFVPDQGAAALVRPSLGLVLPSPRVPLSAARIRVHSTQPLSRPLWIGARFLISL